MIGTTVAHYKIIDKLGEGGMGEVYRGHDTKLGRDVAIKVLPDLFVEDEERLARFEREARMLAALDHANIAAIYGLEQVDGKRFLIMQLADGATLQERIGRGRIPVQDALKIARQIAEALESAHAKGIIHRDLKPANVKVDDQGQVKVLDFGLAKAIEGDPTTSGSHPSLMESPTLTAQMTGAGVLLGTAAYMSPEQARGEAADKRADLWSFGVVLWEMLTGNQLFVGKTMSDTLAGVLRDEPSLEALPHDTPASVRRLLRRCLEREVHERLPDAAAARLELEDALAGRSDLDDVESVEIVPTAPFWKRALPWALFGATALALAAALLLGPEETVVPRETMRLEVTLSDQPLWVTLGSSVVLSPDGSKLAFASDDEEGTRTLALRSLDQLDPLTIAKGQVGEQPYHPFFSPDGKWIGFATPTELKKVPTTGGTPITLCDVQRSRGATWTVKDQIIFAPEGGTPLHAVSAAGGEPRPVTTFNEERGDFSHRWPFAMPDGRSVLYSVGFRGMLNSNEAIIDVVDLETGQSKALVEGGYYPQFIPTGHLVFIRDATLFAVTFDPEAMELTGSPAPVVQGIVSNEGPGGAQYSYSLNGTFAYVGGVVELPKYPVVWVDREGASSILWDTEASYGAPALSPDGKRLALSVLRDDNWDVWVYDVEREVATRLTFDDGYDADQFWSHDGQYLFFSSDRDGQTRPYRKRADGSGEVERLSESELGFYPLSVSPDGRWVIGESQTDNIDIAVLDLEAMGEPEVYLASEFMDRDPNFSPDGRWVAYSSNESGSYEIYVRPFPAAAGRWQVSDGGGRFPRWSGTGKELFYRTGEGIMVANIEASGDSFQVGKATTVFEGSYRGGMFGIAIGGFIFSDYAVAPDGQRFVMFPGSDGQSANTHVTMVFNWFDELANTLPTPN
jgi:serine/threonine protein kinase/Tol biopolymer transport system component